MKKEEMRADLEKHIETTRDRRKITGYKKKAWSELNALRALVEVAKEKE